MSEDPMYRRAGAKRSDRQDKAKAKLVDSILKRTSGDLEEAANGLSKPGKAVEVGDDLFWKNKPPSMGSVKRNHFGSTKKQPRKKRKD